MASKQLGQVKGSTEEKWEDAITFLEMKKNGGTHLVRVVGPVFVYGRHWVLVDPNDPDGKKFPRECTNFDSDTETAAFDRGCPCCSLKMKFNKGYLANVIDRESQEMGMPEPVKSLKPLPGTAIDKIIGLAKYNKGVAVSDEKNGADFYVGFDNRKTAADKWEIQKHDRTPLTEAERKYKTNNFDKIYPDFSDETIREMYNAATKQSLERLGYFKDAEVAAPVGNATAALNPPSRLPKAGSEEQPTAMQSMVNVDAPKLNAKAAIGFSKEAPTAKVQAPVVQAKECPFPDDSHAFGNFQGDSICMKCPVKNTCIMSGDDADGN